MLLGLVLYCIIVDDATMVRDHWQTNALVAQGYILKSNGQAMLDISSSSRLKCSN